MKKLRRFISTKSVADIASLRRSSIGGIYFISLIRNNETINTIKIR